MENKNNFLKLSIITIFIGLLAEKPMARWEQLHVAFFPSITCLTSSGTNLIEGFDGGLAVSTDSGASWTVINPTIYNFTANPTLLFAKKDTIFAIGGRSYNRSADNGKTWDNQYFNDTIVGTGSNDSAWFFAVQGKYGGIFRGKSNYPWNEVADSVVKKMKIHTFAIITTTTLIK